MNIDLNTKCGSTEFLNFSDALNHLRWGEKIARRGWRKKKYAKAVYGGTSPTHLTIVNGFGLSGADIMAEDWYVLSEDT